MSAITQRQTTATLMTFYDVLTVDRDHKLFPVCWDSCSTSPTISMTDKDLLINSDQALTCTSET